MTGTDPAAAPWGGVLERVAARLTSPVVYLGVLGLLQAATLWELRSLYGDAPVLAFVALLLIVMASLAWIGGAWRLKLAGTCLLAGLSAFVPTVIGIVHRAGHGVSSEHDGLLQIESAIDRLLHHQPIYGVDWSATPMARLPWDLPGGNPALHHLAYVPLTILAGVPFRLAADALRMPFDYRAVLLVFAAAGMAAILWLPIAGERKVMVLCAIFVNPLITLYLWSGRNDIEFLVLIFAVLALLGRRRLLPGALLLGIAVALKPFAWPAVPFFLLLLFLESRARAATRQVVGALLALAAVPLITILPFVLANPVGFWTDTVLYTSGGVRDAYPIGGYGFGAFLLQHGWIAHRTDAFPFGAVQLAAGMLVLLLAGGAFLRRPTLSRWMGGYALLLLTVTFFARFFNDNYVGMVVALLLTVRPLGNGVLTSQRLREPERLVA